MPTFNKKIKEKQQGKGTGSNWLRKQKKEPFV